MYRDARDEDGELLEGVPAEERSNRGKVGTKTVSIETREWSTRDVWVGQAGAHSRM